MLLWRKRPAFSKPVLLIAFQSLQSTARRERVGAWDRGRG